MSQDIWLAIWRIEKSVAPPNNVALRETTWSTVVDSCIDTTSEKGRMTHNVSVFLGDYLHRKCFTKYLERQIIFYVKRVNVIVRIPQFLYINYVHPKWEYLCIKSWTLSNAYRFPSPESSTIPSGTCLVKH